MSKKGLPSISHPMLSIELPLSKAKVQFRPFTVREQQVLVLAQQSEDIDSIYASISNVLSSCTNNTIDLESTSLCDLSYLFLQMYIASNGSDITLKTVCSNEECKHDILMRFDLTEVGISTPVDRKIQLTTDVGMILRYPTYKDTLELAKVKNDPEAAIFLLVESIYDSDSVYEKSDYTLDEFREWFVSMSADQLQKVYNFVDKIPDISYNLKYHCPKCKKQYSKPLEDLQTFFRLGAQSKLDRGVLQD